MPWTVWSSASVPRDVACRPYASGTDSTNIFLTWSLGNLSSLFTCISIIHKHQIYKTVPYHISIYFLQQTQGHFRKIWRLSRNYTVCAMLLHIVPTLSPHVFHLMLRITNYMEQSPWKPNSHSASQEIPRFSWSPKVHTRTPQFRDPV